ncbi:MAG TPA: alpha/beta hydrolase, partial [Anaerolineae bacterium]|nr:alpha/beta hydrolase [Anaerolineae bacterium]
LAVGAVHLVAWSYAGHIALEVALKQPALLRSVFIYEPGAPTFVTDPVALETFGADATLMFGPVFEAVHGQGDIIEGVRRLIDGSGRREGYFEGQTQAQQDGQLENAKTMPLQLSQSPPPLISCEQLGILTLPVCIAYGELTRPLFKVVSQAAAQCIPNCRLKVIDGVNHMWPIEDPLKFTAEVTDFLQGS